jgi:hypothetical protein
MKLVSDMTIYVKQKGKKFVVTLMDGTDTIKERVVTGIEARDKAVWEFTDMYNVSDVILDSQKSAKKTYKQSPIPTIPVFDEEEAVEFFEMNQEFVYNRIVQAIAEGVMFGFDSLRLFELNGTGVYITSKRANWKAGLLPALKYYENTEQYEKCSKVRDLILIL